MVLPLWLIGWRVQVRDLIELVLVPGLATVLPWRWCFRLFRVIAHRWHWLYRNDCQRALDEAVARGWVAAGDEAAWLTQRRLVTLIDHADLYLALTRSQRWMVRHLRVDGHWPDASQPGIFCTFHWGAGMWALRHAGHAGMKAHALVAPLNSAQFNGRPVLHTYAHARTALVSKALKNPALDVSTSLRPVLRALRNAEQVMAAVDVPSDQVASSTPVCIAGMTALVPKGLLRLAVDHAIPVTVYVVGIDLNNGQRTLTIASLGVAADFEALVTQVFQQLDSAIQKSSAAWHFWAQADRFFVPEP